MQRSYFIRKPREPIRSLRTFAAAADGRHTRPNRLVKRGGDAARRTRVRAMLDAGARLPRMI